MGAYRQGGFIDQDYDIDIVVPIWLNLDIFNVSNVSYDNCPYAQQMLLQDMNKTNHVNESILDEYMSSLEYDHRDRLCGLSQVDWKFVLFKYLMNKSLFTNESYNGFLHF